MIRSAIFAWARRREANKSESVVNWKMIPFTKLPPIDELSAGELTVRASLLGLVCGAEITLIAWGIWWVFG